MKKKALFLILLLLGACFFVLNVSAATVYTDNSGKEMFRYETDSNNVITTTKGAFPKTDENNKELTWYITKTKTENGNTVHTVASAYSLDESFATLENGVYTYVGTTKDMIVSANFPDNAGILTLNIGEGFGAYSKTFPYANAKILFCYFPNTLNELPLRMFQLSPVIEAEFDDDAVITTIPQIFAHKAQNLKSIEIPASVNTICAKSWWEGAAFYGCISLETITISKGVTSIGNEAFSECTALTQINFNATAMDETSSSNNGIFYLAGQGSEGITVNIGKNVTKIPDYLFCPNVDTTAYSPKITEVVFETGSVCTSIGKGAFNHCKSLEYINIPNCVNSIGLYAFSCTGITTLELPSELESIDYVFYGCASLKSVTIPEKLKSLGHMTFYGCTVLTEINFNATAMDDLITDNDVFYNAGRNGNGIIVKIGKNVTKIPARLLCPESAAREYYPKVTKVIFEENSQCTSIGQSAFNRCRELKNINVPTTVTSIGKWAFQDNYSLTSITIPKNVTSIGNNAFSECQALVEINFNAIAMGDLETGNTVFYNAGKTGNGITVKIGNNVTKIPARLFCPDSYSTTYSPKVTKVIFEENSQCTSIEQSAFNQCCYLEYINIPSTVTTIGPWAFQNNYALTNIIIPQNITSIGNDAFVTCNALTIYAEASSKHSGWNSSWNSSNRPVVWDYKNTIKNDVFTFKGYSFNESGSMAYGYDIDYEAKSLYEELTGDILEIGVVFAGYDNLSGNQPLDSKGQEAVLEAGKVVKASITSFEYSYYDFILYDVTDSIKDVKLVISAYIYDQEIVKFVQENGLSNTVTGVSYNEAKGSVA